MQIVLKELRETKICLKIIEKKKFVPFVTISSVIKENEELVAIFAQSVKTAKLKL